MLPLSFSEEKAKSYYDVIRKEGIVNLSPRRFIVEYREQKKNGKTYKHSASKVSREIVATDKLIDLQIALHRLETCSIIKRQIYLYEAWLILVWFEKNYNIVLGNNK